MHPWLNIAVKAARRAGDHIARQSGRLDTVRIETKQPNDFVTDVDRAAEARIIETIHEAYPQHAILAEESGSSGESETVWIIDPLDGTTNFIHGIPHVAVSIGIRHQGRLEHAVVFDPMRQELFTASRGRGAFLDNRRIRVSQCRGLAGALIGTGIPARTPAHAAAYFGMMQAVAGNAAGLRRAGAAALDLAYVAAGRLDGFWELGLKPWDLAAGLLLIQEAGGVSGDLTGAPEVLAAGNVVGGNPRVFAALVRAIGPHLTPALKGKPEAGQAG